MSPAADGRDDEDRKSVEEATGSLFGTLRSEGYRVTQPADGARGGLDWMGNGKLADLRFE